MKGIQIGEDFVSEEEAREQILGFIRRTVGPRPTPKSGKPKKPDLLFAISVIKRTIPRNILKGDRREEFERAIDTLFAIRDEMSQMETTIGIFWRIENDEPPAVKQEDE